MIGAALDRLFGTLVQTPATAGAPASTSGPFLSAGLLLVILLAVIAFL
ncbi:MAG: hypothetical protein K1X65_06690 [Caldilineales bacterium]|nr:hypothetical protein [Caldilineales bacterium]MCW5860804.1 hypothetical protein [Caldilineales bacterium]